MRNQTDCFEERDSNHLIDPCVFCLTQQSSFALLASTSPFHSRHSIVSIIRNLKTKLHLLGSQSGKVFQISVSIICDHNTFFNANLLLCGDALYSRWHGIVSETRLKKNKSVIHDTKIDIKNVPTLKSPLPKKINIF